MKQVSRLFQFISLLVVMLVMSSATITAQTVRGNVVDDGGEPLIGATVIMKGKPDVATVTDLDGNFVLKLPSSKATLRITYVGMVDKEVNVTAGQSVNVKMESDAKMLNETVVVGYGQQKKASVVGSITQTTGEVLERSAGISDIGAALTGNLPGVITTSSSGMPGDEEPKIVIRGATSWNNTDPLILVDGIERPMSSVDMSSVASVSVLKDASATAVYGVKGANGVILITTKRGSEGKAKINATVNMIMKVPSKLPNKYDSYDALEYRNQAIEHELPISSGSWDYIKPQSFIDNFRNQTTLEQRERYPNVDWQDALFKKSTMSYNANLNASGGSKFVKYFASVDFVNEGDLFKVYDNNRGYKSGYAYNRINVRSNLDFQITKTTVFKMNIAGGTGKAKSPWGNSTAENGNYDWSTAQQWAGAYNIAPDVFLPVYSNGNWGYYPSGTNVTNSAMNLSVGGISEKTTTSINTDFSIDQDLSFITKGLNFHGMISWDNRFVEYQRGVNDLYNDAQQQWIDPETGAVNYKSAQENNNKFDFQQPVNWNVAKGSVQDWSTYRALNYQLLLNWSRKFGVHDLSAMGTFNRQEKATGSNIPSYREDWAFRVTYNYASRYFVEYNGCYNGSERFSPDNRFVFFNSGALGWMLSEEKFMKGIKWLDMLKLRASYGEIGDDNVPARWLYMNQWEFIDAPNDGVRTFSTDVNQTKSPYGWYREKSLGVEGVHWEKSTKTNIGFDYAVLGGLIAGSFDYFKDRRTAILVGGGERAIPMYFGQNAPTDNLGRVENSGYEFTVRFNKVFANKMRVWADMNITHAKNKIIAKSDAPLLPSYRKNATYSIGQTKAYIDKGFLNSYDDLYGSPKFDTNDNQRLAGDRYIVDFNGDGVVDANDQAPYGYAGTPQNTYNATLGFAWKGFSCFVQFYGVNNVTREVNLSNFGGKLDTVYDQGEWWTPTNSNADVSPSRWNSTSASYANGTRYLYDGSYIRLKNAEVAYTFDSKYIKKMGIDNLKLYVSGNNLWVWSRLPDDRESNFAGGGGQGAYPTVKRINFGLKVGF